MYHSYLHTLHFPLILQTVKPVLPSLWESLAILVMLSSCDKTSTCSCSTLLPISRVGLSLPTSGLIVHFWRFMLAILVTVTVLLITVTVLLVTVTVLLVIIVLTDLAVVDDVDLEFVNTNTLTLFQHLTHHINTDINDRLSPAPSSMLN